MHDGRPMALGRHCELQLNATTGDAPFAIHCDVPVSPHTLMECVLMVPRHDVWAQLR
jgi:hypothetical protein